MSTVHKSLQTLYIYVHNLHFFFFHPLEKEEWSRERRIYIEEEEEEEAPFDWRQHE